MVVQWVKKDDMKGFISQAQGTAFSTVAGRTALLAKWGSLRNGEPFSRVRQWPQDEVYININSGDWPSKIRQMASSLNYKQADEQGMVKEETGAPPSGEGSRSPVRLQPEEPKKPLLGQDAFNKALLGFEHAIEEMGKELGKGDGVCGRLGFEWEYELEWEAKA